jgi:hypothetical protein
VSAADDAVLAAGDGDDARSSERLRALREGDERAEGPDGPGLRAAPWGEDHSQNTNASGSVRTEAVWHGGGTRDAYEALLMLLFAPEREPVERECE